MTSRSTKRITALICALGLMLSASFLASGSWASPEVDEPFADYAESPPTLSSADDLGEGDPAGYYRIENGDQGQTVYWMPEGAAEAAPSEIKETPA